jgi:Cd2+/Zn2+-exporting ATPase
MYDANTLTPSATSIEPRLVARMGVGRGAGWFRRNVLAVAAVSTWMFTISGLLLDRVVGASQAVIVGVFVLAYLFGGTLALRSAIQDLVHRTVNVDLLMVAAAIGAATIDAWAEGALLLALFSTSNALEHAALDRTRNAIRSLITFAPRHAIRVGTTGEEVVEIGSLAIGDIVRARPGERIPADGVVASGASDVDQSAITGESVSVSKQTGDPTFAGTVNGSGSLTIRVTRLSSDSVLARIVRLVEEARSAKSRVERATDRLEGPYTLGVIGLAIVAGVAFLLFGESGGSAYYRAMTVLVVASPCALVIATPAASLSALANSARNGVLVKGGGYLDQLGRVTTVALDKTGTLTTGKPELTDVLPLGALSQERLLSLVAAVERSSEHPIAGAMVAAAGARRVPWIDSTGFRAITGKGVLATVEGETIAIGNEKLLAELGIRTNESELAELSNLRDQGKTAMLVASRSGVLGIVALADAIRAEAPAMVASLRNAGVKRIAMLSGDDVRVVKAVAEKVGITEYRAGLLPEEKIEVIRSMKESGTVAMVGDGVNDAPALALADIGVAMGAAGSDVAMETADAVLMGDDLSRLPQVIALGGRMRRIIRANLLFAIGVVSVLTAVSLTSGLALPLGVLGHEGSTVIVLLNGLRLLGGTMVTGNQRNQAAISQRPSHSELQPDAALT